MKLIPKPTLVEERHFPFECSMSTGVKEDFRVMHWHTELEICCIQSGEGSYLINGTEYPFSAGDIFLIGNDAIHLCHDDRNLIMQVMMFDPAFLHGGSANPLDYEYLRPFLEAPARFSSRIDGSSPHTPVLRAILSEIGQEYEHAEKGYELMIKSLLLKFLALIIRHLTAEEAPAAQNPVSRNAAEKVRDVMGYIDTHFSEHLTLESLAAEFAISTPYLSGCFKSLTGLSPIDFVIRRRIAQAKLLLTTTELSVLDVSCECGFRSLSNFNHLFKTHVGCTPSAYRKQ